MTAFRPILGLILAGLVITADAPAPTVQVLDRTSPSHVVTVIVGGRAYDVRTIEGPGSPPPPPSPTPPPIVVPAPSPAPDPSLDPLEKAVKVYFWGIPPAGRLVADSIESGKVTSLAQARDAIDTERKRAATLMVRWLADSWAPAVDPAGNFTDPKAAAAQLRKLSQAQEAALGPLK